MATTRQLWQQNNNRLYWEKREQKQRELYMMEEAQQQRELEKIYAEMYRHAEDEINRFYGKYADAEGIDITEAKKRVTQADIEAYEALAKEYVKNKDFSDRANAEMRLYNATMKINRLEMLKARIGVYLVAGINDIDDYYEKVITDRTRQEIERQAGILGETVSVADTTKRAENIVNASFFNATYSERIWSHQDRLRSMISIELQKGLIAGISSRQMASNIRKEYDVSLADAHRLMVTELRRVQTDVAMDSYKASGVQKYVYMAVNPRACPICREIDGNVYDVADAEPAKNAPPMHPRCHCTTAPYVEEDDYNAWLNYLSQGGRTSDWNNMSPAERQKYASPVVQSESKQDTNQFTKLNSEDATGKEYKALLSKVETWTDYKQVTNLQKAETEAQRISKIGGGDKTKGSCASLGLCYIGRKLGWDVLDFRGGSSQAFFSTTLNLMTLSNANGIKKLTATGKSPMTVGGRLLKQVEEGKEYYLCCGRHASIVRMKDGVLQYLELQSSDRNGWTDFNGNPKYTLSRRFGCPKGSEYLAEETNFMIDLQESDFNTDEFRTLLGYLNTSEDQQRKGKSGTIK